MAPLDPPPYWLHPGCEVTEDMEPPKLAKAPFVLRCFGALTALGCSSTQAIAVTANAVTETGWGRHYRAWNLGGWKIRAGSSQTSQGAPRRWWRAAGHTASGDAPTCFYRAFQSPEEFFAEWLKTFVPRTSPEGRANARYQATGQAFWSGAPWFDDLIAAGYKGDVTRMRPDASIEAHAQIIDTLTVFWCQEKLGATPDGAWGPKSAAAAKAYQSHHELPVTGELDAATRHLLLHGVKLVVPVVPVAPEAPKAQKSLKG